MTSLPQSPPWDVHRLPRAEGRNVLVTGGNAGIGYFVAEQLAATGATVVLGSRDRVRAEAAIASIGSRVPGARVRHLPLDLADLASLGPSVQALPLDRLDAVVHNAGVALDHPPRRETADGHELMFATNHLGHFALTHHLAPLLAATPGSRIVTTGSFAAKSEHLDLDDLQSTRDYRPKRTYARSKLAQMLFAVELDRRLRAAGSTTLSLLVHPGGALDSLTPSRPPLHVRTTGARLRHLPLGLVVQGKDAAAWPAVRAVLDPAVLDPGVLDPGVLDPGVRGGRMWSPRAFGLRGAPRAEPLWSHLTDTATATRLWAASRELTGLDPAPATYDDSRGPGRSGPETGQRPPRPVTVPSPANPWATGRGAVSTGDATTPRRGPPPARDAFVPGAPRPVVRPAPRVRRRPAAAA